MGFLGSRKGNKGRFNNKEVSFYVDEKEKNIVWGFCDVSLSNLNSLLQRSKLLKNLIYQVGEVVSTTYSRSMSFPNYIP